MPSTPEKKVPGTLSISDGGWIELEVTELLEDKSEPSNSNLKRVVGTIQKNSSVPSSPVTLDSCTYRPASGSKLISVNRAFSGVAFEESDVLCFNTFTFSVEGIDEWIGISGVKVDSQPEMEIPTISYERPSDFLFELENDMRLLITWRASWNHLIAKETRISEKVYFQLVSQNVRELGEFIAIARKIVTFLCFAVDKTVCLDEIEATSENLREDIGEGKTRLIPVNIYYPSWPYTADESVIAWDDMLFRFEDIRDNTNQVINSWIHNYNQSGPAFDSYFLAKIGIQKHLDERFLSLVQGLEAYHRSTSDEKQMDPAELEELVERILEQCPKEKKDWVKSRLEHNEISLRRRVKKLIEPFKDLFGSRGNRSALINRVVETRNRLTHHGLSLELSTTNSKDLWILYQKVELLFQLHFLQLIGFNREEINSILSNCPKLQEKCAL